MAEKNLLSTFGDFLVEIGRGISNTTEGIIDAHIAPVAWVGGLFDKDFKKRASETIAYNWTDDHIKKWGWDKVREKSYASTWRGGGETARGIAEGVGAMLPSLALSAIPYAGPALSQTSMSMGAGGKNMEQAINEGANFDNAFLYGIVSGSLEAGIERLGGHVMGGGSSIIGKKLAGTSLGKFTSKGVGKMLEVGVSEAGEELISAYSDPFVKAGTGVDVDIGANLSEAIQNTGKTALTGAAVGSILHGAGTGVRNISNTVSKRGGARATRADNFLTSFTELGENYSADEKQNAKTLKAQNEYLRSMSQEIQGMDETSRENYLKSSPLKQVFNAEDGTLKLDLVRENTNNEAVSSSIKAYSGTFEHAPITNEEVIGEGARATKSYIEQILGKKARVIITSEYSDNTNASFSISEGVFYVNNNATELSKEQVAKQVAIHEIVHYTEGTEQYYEMVDELAKVVEDSNAPVEVKKRIGDLSKRLEAIKKDYQGDTEGMNEALKQYVYQTEGVADLVGDLLADEQTITRLAQRNESFVKKLLTKIKALANKSAKVDSEATKYLNKLVKSFEKAIDNAHGGVSLRSIGNTDEEKEGKVALSNYNNAEINIDIISLIEKVQDGNFKPNEKVYLGVVSNEMAQEIENIVGFSVQGFKVVIEARQIEHIIKNHGEKGKTDQSMKNPEDLGKIEYVLDNADSVVKSGRTQAYSYMKDGRNRTAETILYEKVIGEKSYYVVQAVPDTKAKTLYIVSAFIGKSGYKKEASQLINAKGPDATAKTGSESASTNIIPENGENVKKSNKNILDERHSYAGRRAKTANSSTLESAERMLAEGVDAETIRKETGWFMGYDKKWRFEIDDSQMKVNSDTSNYTTLDKLIEHEALFSAYPELRQLRITFSDLRESRGSYDRRFGDISIDYSLKGDAENLKMLLIHEIQHAIQDIESFARGASPEFWENKIAQGFDTRTKYVKQQETELLEKIKKKRHENRDFIEDIEFLVDSTPNKPRGKVDWETLEQIEEDPPEWRSFDRRREQLAKEYGEEEVFEYMEAISNLERLRHTMDRYDAYALYMFTAGEIEARDTASRLELDAEQRKNNRPNIDEEVVVFADDSTVSREIKYPVFSEKDIENNMVEIAHMQPVIIIDASKLEKSGRTPKSIFEEYFESLGKTIRSPVYGDISLSNSSVKSEIRHGITATKIASIEAIPTIIEKGKVIFHLKKDGGVERIVICAPIKIAQDNYYMGVMLQRDAQTQYLYLHNVVIEKEMLDTSKTHLVTTGVNEENKHLSISSILQKAINVKKNIENGIEERYSKKRSYNPTENADFEDEGNVWVEDEQDGVKVILSTPDFNNPNYEKNHAPGYRLSDTYDGDNPEAYVIEGKQNILSENSTLKKFVADNIKLKKYSRKDAASILFEIMNEKGYFDKINTKFKGKSKAEIERMLWDALNIKVGGQRGGAALDIADAIITNLLVTEQYEMTPELELAYQVVNYLKTHLHNVNLDHIKGDIKVKYDKNNSPFALWARKEGTRGVTADQIKEELEVEIPGIRINATTEADIFLEIDELYRNAREIIKESTPEKTTLLGVMDSNEVKALRQSIARDILKAYDKYGAETTFSKLEKKYLDRLNKLSHKLYDEQRMGKLERLVLKEIRKIVDNKNGKYANATQVQTDALENIKNLLGKINSREQINRTSTRDIMKAFSEWYKKDNPVLEGFYLEEMAELVDYFSTSQGKAKLTYSELDIIRIVLHHMNFVFENYGKIFRLGKFVEAKDVAKDYLKVMKEALDSQSTIEKLLFKNKATRFFMDPTAVAAQYDGHDENGFFTQTLKEFQEGLIMQRYYEMVALEEFKEFTEKKHKKYFKELLKGKRKINVGAEIDIRGLEVKTVEVPVYYAMELYMVSKTGEAIQTLEETGWMLKLDDSKEQKQMGKLTKEQIEAIYNQFTAEDKQLITIMEKAYNGICRELKLETDMKRLGFSNVFDGYYYPIHRFTATEFDSNDFFVEMERVSKVGFNNNRVKGAKQALLIGNVFSTFIRHVNAVTRYSALSIPISNMKMVYNMDVGENANMPESIKMWVLTNKMWNGAQDYFQKLADDVQQIGVKPDEGSKVFAYLRGAYAKSALGANPKVWFSQLSSYLAAFGELHFTSLARASTIKGFIKDSDVDKYCKLAAVRHYERGATRAMTVTDQIGKVGEILTAPIEMVDRQVVKMLFAACQAEVKSRYRLDIGTEENKIKAGELLKDVILRSQQNQLITEQSEAMRSTSEFTRSLTMFNADSMKLLSRFIEYVGKTATLSKKMKQAQSDGNEALYIELSSQHKTAVKHLCKYSAAIVSIAVYMSLIAKLFKWLYNKDDKEENAWNNFGKDVVGNIIGMVPIVRDIYSYFEDGYDVDNYAFSMINDLLNAVNNTKNAFVQLASGKEVSSQKWSSSIRSLVYSLSQFLGIPTRNIYNFTTGLIRRVDEGTDLKIDSVFYEPSSTTLKEKYLEGKEKGKNSLVGVSLDLMYQNRDIEITDAVLKREMDRLIDKNLTKERDDNTNYSPFGSKIPDTITFNGEEIELTSKQTNGFKTAYKSAEAYSAKTVKTAMYKGLDDESKAYAIRKVYEYYHKSALEDVTGEKAKLVYFGSFIGIDKLALIIAYAKNVKGDSSGTRKEKIELYIKKFGLTKSQASLALRYLGYTDKAMDSQVQNLIKARGSLTKEQKEEFLGYI